MARHGATGLLRLVAVRLQRFFRLRCPLPSLHFLPQLMARCFCPCFIFRPPPWATVLRLRTNKQDAPPKAISRGSPFHDSREHLRLQERSCSHQPLRIDHCTMTAPTSVAAKPLLRPPTTPKRCSVTCAGLLVVAVARGRSCLATTRHSLSGTSLQLRVSCADTPLSGDSLTTATAPAADLLHSTTHLAGLEPRACSDGSVLRPCALLSAGLL